MGQLRGKPVTVDRDSSSHQPSRLRIEALETLQAASASALSLTVAGTVLLTRQTVKQLKDQSEVNTVPSAGPGITQETPLWVGI